MLEGPLEGPVVAALRRALAPACARRSLIVALLVGTVLNLINQGDVWLAEDELDYWKFGLTYLVPFCVATYGAWSMALSTAHTQRGDPTPASR